MSKPSLKLCLTLAGLALAPLQAFAQPVLLGAYEIKSVTLDGVQLCKSAYPDPECGTRAWVIRDESRLALIEIPVDLRSSRSGQARSHLLFKSGCEFSVPWNDLVHNFSSSSLCMATRANRLDTRTTQAFGFNLSDHPWSDPFRDATLLGGLTGVPVGVGSEIVVQVPRSEADRKIRIHKKIRGIALFSSETLHRDYVLERVQE